MNEPSSSESESNSTGISQWQKPGVTFGWVKMTVKSRFQPAFIFPKPEGEEKPRAQYIQLNGDLSDLTHSVEQVATPAEVESVKKSRKSQNYLIAIKKFNGKNNCNYTPNGPQL
ncbi:uncharacterized protein LOC119085473 [Bradysia coprophila]|uniref:uncharacterized protein LOC119085473 n=1 Tax=Bradysia coprophila TaxID=38358 RepID=UPI00187D8E1F|nr:uncharacterized protein LOC119085473 [Bradysia coprophila]